MKPTCLHPRCTRPARARGLCDTHYRYHSRHGSLPEIEPRDPPHAVTLRVAAETWTAIEHDAERAGESAYATAIRWLDERARRSRR